MSRYYWFVNCKNCGGLIVVAEAVDPQTNPFPDADKVKKTCPHCQAEHIYSPRDFQLGEE